MKTGRHFFGELRERGFVNLSCFAPVNVVFTHRSYVNFL